MAEMELGPRRQSYRMAGIGSFQGINSLKMAEMGWGPRRQ